MSQPESTGTQSGNTEAACVPLERVALSGAQSVLSTPSSSAAGEQPGPEQPGAPSLAPVWSRYIDSRLKQFCSR
jgi:hypothetical protein